MRTWLKFSLLLALACDPAGGTGPMRDGGPVPDGGDPGPLRDADGDGIGDDWEGRADNVDTDGDGTPDYLDTDSDGDGIPDSDERGLGGGSTPPDDVDLDGTPSFRDLDSDDNGILDADEGSADTDGDMTPDYRDLDDDGDSVRDAMEIGADPSNPEDFDGDGLPDYRDIDSDDDTIGDRDEANPPDTDGDGFEDRHDLDSDGDGWTDEEEAGDTDPTTPPVDTDGDRIPDFRDTDSDGDGLSDAAERELGTARDNRDTDGDGVTDLVEVGACGGDPACAGDATDPTSSPRTRGDFVFFEPYMEAPDPLRDTLDFATDIRVADVYFLIDTTGSMSGPISSVRTSLSSAGGIIDRVRAAIPDVQFGVGEFKDYSDSRVYNHQQDITNDATLAQAAVNRLSASGGGDGPEGGVPAAFSTITGTGMTGGGAYPDRAGCPAGTFGYGCFRTGAVPIVVIVMDNYFHNGPGGAYPYTYNATAGGNIDYARTITALTAANARVVGVGVGSTPLAHLQAMATDTGAVDAGGAPLVSMTTGSGVSDGVVMQIETLASSVSFDITVVFEDDTSDAVDTFASFVDHIEANTAGDAARGCDPRPADDTDSDGFPDTFRDVRGARVCFDIVVKQNDTVMPLTTPQVFNATLRVIGDGFTELDSRGIFFLVPPTIMGPGGPD